MDKNNKVEILEKLTRFQDCKIKLIEDENKKLNKINKKLHLALNCAINLLETYFDYGEIRYTDDCKRMKQLIREINKLEEK